MVRPSCPKSQEYPFITHPETEAISIDAASFPLVYSLLRKTTSCPFDGLIIYVFNEMRPPCQDDACLPRELRFAWLLRDDIRNGAAIDDPEAQKEFEIWWFLHGNEEYPAAARRLDPSSPTHLSDVISPAPAGEFFSLTRLMRHIWRERTDVRAKHSPDSPEGYAGFIRWFFVYGVPEHSLFNHIPNDHVGMLTRPVYPVAPHIPALSTLAWYSWLINEGLQASCPLNDLNSLARYLGWYFCEGVRNLGHGPYWHMQPPLWLKTDHPVHTGVCWLAYMAWLWLNPEARDVGLAAREQRERLMAWFWVEAIPRFGLEKLFAVEESSVLSGIGSHVDEKNRSTPAQRKLLPGVNIIGFAKGELGIGEDSRMAALALQAASVPFAVVNVPTGPGTRQQDSALDAYLDDSAPYAVNLFCLTGFDTARVYLEHELSLFEGRYNIGWWPWELPVWPADWRIAFNLVDEVWAATEFTREMYFRAQRSIAADAPVPRPVTLMPMAVSVARALPVSRQKLGLPNDRFLFLYVFDFNSYLDRKNPFAVVKAFRHAFPAEDTSVGLVLKTMNSNPKNRVWQRFLKECAKDERIAVFEKTLDRGEVLGLIDACDSYVSLHRSEGFGRTLAEAMLLGKPVVGTNFSGNVDFLKPEVGFPVTWKRRPVKPGEYPFVTEGDGAWWAEPDRADAARQMRAAWVAVQNKPFVKQVRSFAKKQFAPERIGSLMKQRLDEIVAQCF